MAPCSAASRVMPRMTDSVKECVRRAVCMDWELTSERPRLNSPGPSLTAYSACARPHGLRLPNQMKLAPLPAATVIVQPRPPAHAGPLVGNVWCQPDCTTSQSVYVPAGRPVKL